MDSARGLDDRLDHDLVTAHDSAVDDVALDIGGDERRMHVRAYNHWVSLLQGRAYPSIEDLDPASIADFGGHSVLLDFSKGVEDPTIQFLGRALREECGIGMGITRVAEVPSRSLLSRLTDHYLQIIANRAPIGFEAEFVSQRGHNTLYRGILMPFSSDEDTIDFIYGVINWKEMVDAETQAKLTAEVAAARRVAVPPASPAAAPWADGPGATLVEEAALATDAPLAARLGRARESAASAAASETRSRAVLYRALGRAYEFARAAAADPEAYEALLTDEGLTVQARAPMTPIVKLVFGADYDKTRVTEFAAVLAHAERHGVVANGLASFLEGFAGGIKGIVAAERVHRRPADKPDAWAAIAAELRDRAPIAHVAIDGDHHEFVVLLARRSDLGGLDVIACVEDDPALIDRALRRAAA